LFSFILNRYLQQFPSFCNVYNFHSPEYPFWLHSSTFLLRLLRFSVNKTKDVPFCVMGNSKEFPIAQKKSCPTFSSSDSSFMKYPEVSLYNLSFFYILF